MLSGCQPGITKAAGILKRKVNTTNRQKTDRQKKKKKKTNQKKKTGTECILIWENGSWLTTANVNALSSLPTHGHLLCSKSPFQEASWGVSPGLLRGSTRGLFWQVQPSGLALPGPCPAEIMYCLLGLRPVLKGSRPHNTALWLPLYSHRLRTVAPQDEDRAGFCLTAGAQRRVKQRRTAGQRSQAMNGSSQATAAGPPPNILF